MNDQDVSDTIALPQWYAGFRFETADGVLGARPLPPGTVRVGPLVIGRARSGCETSQFGSPDRPSVVLFDGFLFDRAEKTRELAIPAGSRHADVAAAAYQRWGIDFLSHLSGHYLVAVWDARAARLFIAHDPLGRNPVYFSRSDRSIWFGSNVLALAASGAVPTRPNRLSLLFAAITLWPEAGDTFFADISRLRVGHYLQVSPEGDVHDVKFWDPLPESPDDWMSEHEVFDGFEPALERAVARCMELSPDGIMLSGGVDSVTIAALATNYRRQHGQSPIVAFSGRPDVPMLQEEHMQTLAADALGLPHIVTRTSEWTRQRNDVDVSLEVTPQLPGPSRIYWVGTYMGFYRTAVEHKLRVLLTGSGGDNWLSVADVHAADLIRSGRFIQLGRFVYAAAHTGGSSYGTALRQLVWHGGIRALADSVGSRLLPERKRLVHRSRAEATLPEWLCPDVTLRREFLDRWVARRAPGLDTRGRIPANYYHNALASVSNPHLYYEFEVAFHVDRICGVRLLSPYHDADVVQYFNRIPPALLVRGNKYKGLLRPIVDRYLPGLGFGNQRKDYPQQAADLDLENLREGVMRAWPTYRFETLERLDLVKPTVSAVEAAKAPGYRIPALVNMFALMSAELWTSRHTS